MTICKKSNTYKLHVSLNPKEFREFLKIMGEIIGDTIRDHETIHETVEIALHYIVLKSIIDIVVYPFSAIVRIFPAQRNTLMLDFVKSAINIATREEKEQIRLIKSEPILKFLKLIDLFIPSKSEKSSYYDLGSKLESILGGEVIISEDGDVRFKINENTSLKLTVSSSMVQQLSSLALYLKHLAKFGDLIIIDEPESNLHPEAQKKVVEIIAEMVNRGLWIIVTTHSPFIIDYLNTLMKAYKVANISDEAKEQVLEVIENENVLLSPEHVSVYLFTKEGSIENVKKDYIIDLKSFRKIIDEIGAMFTELLIIEDIYQKSVGETDETTD